MRLSNPLVNAVGFFFPRLCIVCKSSLARSDWLCPPCLEKLRQNHLRRDPCPLCAQNRALRRCTCQYVWTHPFDAVFSLFDFDDIVRGIAHEVKYNGRKRLALDVGKDYGGLVPGPFLEGMDAMVPVPLHFFRLMKRGFNQAEYYAKGVLKGSGAEIPYMQGILVRKRNTKTQTRLSRLERRKNILGAFVVPAKKRGAVRNKNIILVDDVVTTGATVGECARALLETGCASVKVLSLARD